MNCIICMDTGLVTNEPEPRPWVLPALPWSEADRTLACIVLNNPPYVGAPIVGARACSACPGASEGTSSPAISSV